jgi:hypothetical protein
LLEATPTTILTLNPGVSSARINPHPRRLPTPSAALQPGHPIPLFEKSNVLVMYVLLSLKKVVQPFNYILLHPVDQQAQVRYCNGAAIPINSNTCRENLTSTDIS